LGRERQIWGEVLGGGVVLLSPGGDEGPQGCIGGEDPVVSVAVDVGRGKEGGETVQELQSGEAQRGATGGIGFRNPAPTFPRPGPSKYLR